MSLNDTIFIAINNLSLRNPNLDVAFIFFATSFGGILLMIALLFFLVHKDTNITEDPFHSLKRLKKKMKELFVIITSSLSSLVIVTLLKVFFKYPRPFEAMENVRLLFSYGGNDSFPSGHATLFSSLAMALFLYHKRLGIAFFLGAILIGFSRIAVGIHYPLDIIGGYILGSSITYLLYKFYKHMSSRKIE